MIRNRKKAAMGLVFVGLFLLCQFLVAGALSPFWGIWVVIKSVFDGDFVSPDMDIEDIWEYSLDFSQRLTQEFSGLFVVITLLSSMVFLGAMLYWAHSAGVKPMEKIGLRRMDTPYFWLCFLLGLGLNLAASVALDLIPFPESWYIAQRATSVSFDPNNVGLYAVAVAFVVPVAEEVCFRGLCYRYFQYGMGRWLAILLSSLVFGICHGSILALFYTVPLAILMCLVYDRCRSLWANIMIHAGFNFCSVVLAFFPEEVPDALVLGFCLGGTLLAAVSGVLLILRLRREAAAAVPAAGAPYPGAPYPYVAAPYPPQPIVTNGENKDVY